MKFNQVDKKVQLDLFNIVKYQILTHCFINSVILNETELNCLALLGTECAKSKEGKVALKDFNKLASDVKILGTYTAVANCMDRIEHSKLFLKEGGGRKTLRLNPELNIVASGNVLLQYKIFHIDEGNSVAGSSKANSGAAQPA